MFIYDRMIERCEKLQKEDILEDVIVSSVSWSERSIDLGDIILEDSCFGSRSEYIQTSVQAIGKIIEFFNTTFDNGPGDEVVVLGLGGNSAHKTLYMSSGVSVFIEEVISVGVRDRSSNDATGNLRGSDIIFELDVFTASINNTTSDNLMSNALDFLHSKLLCFSMTYHRLQSVDLVANISEALSTRFNIGSSSSVHVDASSVSS